MAFEISKNGILRCQIAVSRKAEPTEQFAASELQKYLDKITGGTFQLKQIHRTSKKIPKKSIPKSRKGLPSILVGSFNKSQSSKGENDDSFSVLRAGKDLVIRGKSPRGTLFGVYWLVRQLGVSFLAPNFDYYQNLGGAEFVTPNPDLKVPQSCLGTHRPIFPLRPRDIGEGGSHTKPSLLALIDWMAKMGHNILRCPARGEGTHSNPHMTSWDVWRDLATPELKKRGILIQIGQHGYQNYLPTGVYFKDHPEWYGELAGRRVPMSECVFCTSNPQARSEFRKNVLEYLRSHPEIDIFDLWPPDSIPWCSCSNCVAIGSESERHARVVEEIRSALKKETPRIKLGIIAYVQYTEFPEKTRINTEVRLDFCPIYRDYKFEIDDVVSETNRTVYWDKLLQWRREWQGEIVIYEYYMKYRFRSFPVIMPRLIAREYSIYEKLGVSGVSNYSEPDTWLVYELSHYLLAICSWSGGIDADEEVRRWAFARVGESFFTQLDEALKLIEGNLRALYSGRFGFHASCALGKLALTTDEMRERLNGLQKALEILRDIIKNSRNPASKAWLEQLARALVYAISDFKVQIAWDDDQALPEALENYHESLAGPQENFDGIIHMGEAGRKELGIHYDSHQLKPHW